MKLLINVENGKKAGILTPIPQYPLYTATIAEFDLGLVSTKNRGFRCLMLLFIPLTTLLFQIGYYPDEEKNWGLDISELKRSIQEGRKKYNPKAIVVINPGNPTGNFLFR